MGWAPDPAATRAADDAAAEAQEAIRRRLEAHANAAMSPFERRLLGVLEDLRDLWKSPVAGPVLATVEPGLPDVIYQAITQALPDGSLLTGPNGPILGITPLAGVPAAVTDDGLAGLADAAPTDLGRAMDAAETAIDELVDNATGPIPHCRIAEVAIDAALRSALNTSSGQDGAEKDGAAGGDAEPPAEHPAP